MEKLDKKQRKEILQIRNEVELEKLSLTRAIMDFRQGSATPCLSESSVLASSSIHCNFQSKEVSSVNYKHAMKIFPQSTVSSEESEDQTSEQSHKFRLK